MEDPIKKKKSKYRSDTYTPEKTINVFGAQLSVPSIESNATKRRYINTLKKGRRNEIFYAQTDEQKEKIKSKYKDEITKARGGKTWAGEKIADLKEFVDDVKILKSQAEKTTLGRIVNQATGIVSAVKSANPEKIINQGVSTYNSIKSINNKTSKVVKTEDGCNCG